MEITEATITLSANALNVISMALQEGPYKMVQPVIEELNRELRAYTERMKQEPS